MSTIDRMSILGVRAFNTQHGETIKFEQPLTLIAGVNGSGKTTITECLKFATTGILPPGSKQGGAFIHDPGLRGEREVMAQVKLGFHGSEGTRLVATRSLQLTVKKATRTQKTLEAMLLMERHGQKTTLSQRVAELDQMVPNYLGASVSLLENVIFCHQEDSLWPLAESGTLKKKFDDIFEAGKYTKAVLELIKIRKKHKLELPRLQDAVVSAKKDRDRARRITNQIQELQNTMEERRTQASDYHQKITIAQKARDEALSASEEFNERLTKLQNYRYDLDRERRTIGDLERRIKVSDETDEWLERALEGFDKTLRGYEAELKAKKQEWLQLEKDQTTADKGKSEKLSERGRYQQEKADYEKRLERRRDMVSQSAAKHQIRGYDDVTDEEQVEEFLYKMRKNTKDSKNVSDRAQKEAEDEKSQLRTDLNGLGERENALRHVKKIAKDQIQLLEGEADKLQNDADRILVNEGSRAVTESKVDEMKNRIEETRTSATTSGSEAKIARVSREIADLESEQSRLNNELVQGTKRAGEVAQLSHLKQEVKDKAKSLSTLTQAHGSRITSLLETDWDAESLEAAFQSKMSDAVAEVTTAETERNAVIQDARQLQFRQKTIRDDLNTKRRQAQNHADRVKQVTDGEVEDFEEALCSATYRLENAQEEVNGLKGITEWYNLLMEALEKNNACRMCERKFKEGDDRTRSKMRTKLENQLKKSSEEINTAALDEAVAEHKRVSSVSVDFQDWKRLSGDEIPRLEKELNKLEKEKIKLDTQVESHDDQVAAKKSSTKDLESIRSIISSITKTQQDLNELNTKVEELTAKQSQFGNIRTLEDIQEELSAINSTTAEAKRTLDRLRGEQKNTLNELHAMDLQLRDLQSELLSINNQLDRKNNLTTRVQDLRNKQQKEFDSMEKADKEIEKIGPELATAKVKLEDLTQRWSDRLQQLASDASSVATTMNALDILNKDIQAYQDNDGANRLSQTERDLTSIETKIVELSENRKQLTREINQGESTLKDAEATKRHYRDNLDLREAKRNVDKLESDIEDLDAESAHTDRERLAREADKQLNLLHRYSGEREGIIGQLKAEDNQLKELSKEYETDLKGAPLRFKEAHIKHETTKAAVEDIGRYSQALDQAITKYHALKMEEVNDVIDDLWKKTYQGTDIDTICIRSELDVKANSRTHNYRVVMVKRDIELDMRGRCSAGQKVLACIIIRLALAECFSKDCGVICLDEPTTNLDSQNIKSLAEALHEIIKARNNQKNFQLIIITHDEQFLAQMNCSEFTDNYYLVVRDPETDYSIIEKNKIESLDRG